MAEEVQLQVVVVGGSIAGLSCALSLLQAGCRVIVLEKAKSLSASGAGLGLDSLSCSALALWNLSHPLLHHSLPLSLEQNRILPPLSDPARIVASDHYYHHRSVHWSDLHRILYHALPVDTVRWGHHVISFEEIVARRRVRVQARIAQSSLIREFEGDLLVAADGSMSETRKRFVPDEKRRYCGYCAWRGVFDASTEEGCKIKAALYKQYPNLGNALYFDIADNTHAVLYELQGGRLNWLWYVNQPEPMLQGSSVTIKADETAIAKMHAEAKKVWILELADLIQATPAPFINAIFDRDPLQQLVWGRVVLVGEAAHPTSPHGLRSTNMSIIDAAVLGQSIIKWGLQVDEALKEFQCLRLPVTSQQVLFSRHLGQVKQGITPGLSHWTDEQWLSLLQRNMHTFVQE